VRFSCIQWSHTDAAVQILDQAQPPPPLACTSGREAECPVSTAAPGAQESTAEQLLELDDASPEALVELFEARGWGDGLPLFPPTPARVDAMLDACAATDPDAVLAVLPPRFGECTPRLVAINAVLAGCPPSVMPVLLAAVRALARPELNLRGVNATTHPVAPLLIVHGEIAETAGFNAGLGAFGSGDASTQGQPSKYTYCVAENLAASPWESYARSVGVDAPSAVTLHCGENPHNFHDMEADRPGPILDKCASAMATMGVNNAAIADAEFFVGLGPEHAATIASHQWSRRDVQSYLFERARLPAVQYRRQFASRAWPPWMDEVPDDAPLPTTSHPNNIRVFVVGGPGKHSCVIPSWGMTRSVTLPVAL
jgi:hypothetical protein